MTRCKLTAERLRQLLDYEPTTGIFRWKTSEGAKKAGMVAGCVRPHGYRSIGISRSFHYAHRLAFLWMIGEWPNGEIDHINGDPADNRWINLRTASRTQNTWNTKLYRNNRSGAKGVWRSIDGRWQAQIRQAGRRFHLGSFKTSEAAVEARKAAEARLHGEFAR